MYKFKVSVIGDPATGKTSMCRRYTEGIWNDCYISTIGVSFLRKETKIDGKSLMLQVWDLGGQMLFSNIRNNYLKGSHGAIIVYDVTEASSFKNIHTWYNELKNCGDIPIFIVGNKLDLEHGNKVKLEHVKRLAGELHCQTMDVSSKTGENVTELFENLSRMMIEKKKQTQDSINLGTSTQGIPTQGISNQGMPNLGIQTEIQKGSPIVQHIKQLNLAPLKNMEQIIVECSIEFQKIWTIISELQDNTHANNGETASNEIINNDKVNSEVKNSETGEKEKISKVNYEDIVTRCVGYMRNMILEVKNINGKNDLKFFELLDKLAAENIEINPRFKEIRGYCNVLIGINYFMNGNLNKSGLSFFYALGNIVSSDPLLSAKIFFITCGLLSLTDYDFFIKKITSEKALLVEFQKHLASGDINDPKSEANTISYYINLGIRYVEAFDEQNLELDDLDAIEYFLKENKDETQFGKFIDDLTEKLLQEMQKTRKMIRFVSMGIQPELINLNDPLLVEFKLANLSRNSINIKCRLIAPGTEYPTNIIGIKMQPRKIETFQLTTGRSRNFGNMKFILEILDAEEFLIEHRIFDFYIPDPSELLRIKSIPLEDLEFKEDKPIDVELIALNKGSSKESCDVKVNTEFFEILNKEHYIELLPNKETKVSISLGMPTRTGKINVDFILLSKDNKHICDIKKIELKITRSFKKIFKDTLITGVTLAKNLIM